MKLTDEARVALLALGEKGKTLVREIEGLDTSKMSKPTPKVKEGKTTYYNAVEKCLTCGAERIVYFYYKDKVYTRLEDGDIVLNATLLPNALTPRPYCEECLMRLDDVPRSSLVWLVETLLPLVRMDKTARVVDTLQKGLGYAKDTREGSAKERRRGVCKEFDSLLTEREACPFPAYTPRGDQVGPALSDQRECQTDPMR